MWLRFVTIDVSGEVWVRVQTTFVCETGIQGKKLDSYLAMGWFIFFFLDLKGVEISQYMSDV